VMVKVFGARLNDQLSGLSLSPSVAKQIQANDTRLADLPVPDDVDASVKSMVQDFIARAFVSGFRVVMLICASLSLASAAAAWVMIQKDAERTAEIA
jgi:hypothetical protein